MKTLMYIAAISLAATNYVPPVYANSIPDVIGVPSIVSTTQFPQSKWGTVRHTFTLKIPQNSSQISQLNINIPAGLTVENDINIFDKSGKRIPANTSVNGDKITIIFSQAIPSDNTISIDLNKVNRIGISNAWLYRVSAKIVGIDTEIPIGIARFRLYY